MPRPAGRKRRLPSARLRSYAQEVLSESACILVKCGHSPADLAREFDKICRGFAEPARTFDPRSVPYVSGLPHIVAHWYTDPSYLNRFGEPQALPLRAAGLSLARLIRRVFRRGDVDAIARSLVQTGAVRRRAGRYIPTDRYVWLAPAGSSVQVHGLTSMVGMLRTVQHNISCRDERSTLLERAAANPNVPIRALPTIHRRIKRDVTAVLWKIDGYLRRWEVEPGSEPTTRVGVGAYAYEDPIVTGTLNPSEPARKQPAIRPSERATKGR